MSTSLEHPQAERKVLYGGQAVVEGVMIRGRDHAALSIRRDDQSIARHEIDLTSWSKVRARRIPMMRGVVVLAETLMVGMRALSISASEAAPPNEKTGEREEFGKGSMAVMLLISLVAGIGIFFLLPLGLSRLAENAGANAFTANVIEGAVRLAIFVGYIWLIGRMSDIRRVFGYHGAEHMAVAAHEAGEPLTVESVRRFPEAHPRCGTSFLMTVVVVSILIFIFIPRDPVWLLVGSRIVLIPVIGAISYELIRYAGTHPTLFWVRLLGAPNLWLQNLTTRPPEDGMIEVAIDAMKYALELDGVTYEPEGSADVSTAHEPEPTAGG
ncbi:MAG: DUF1385 domain-containing protein [Chloroflexi bacterium]|nr:DUF1385 domain-containing protein [Chloroflexota bacterium]